MKKSTIATSVLVISSGVIASAAVHADSENKFVLEEVVVTAQKRAESLQDAALAVSAVSGQGLEDAGVTDVTSLGSIVPSLQISNAYGPSNNFYLRGVGNFVTNALTDGAIAFNVDGVNYARPTSAQGVFFDLDRIEVLKGPQGTLYGKNATGGVNVAKDSHWQIGIIVVKSDRHLRRPLLISFRKTRKI
ncbi:TonB-dependent receptor [Pseudomaricurvus alcaniphilus]|uniref:TonB-dependent receptor plug domain-containing protein n=1 Tax=Pseudomaricurvus alcaniphilus TaxID=1166482 RepID=UPI00140BA2A6|nr:TonB-dependent receptor plug domain-containing protein [Pseudomaricurvus alcaniphilus]NHN39979.1 TonB-dependent receptor [Pseudomaricurvus alcaniphilus]